MIKASIKSDGNAGKSELSILSGQLFALENVSIEVKRIYFNLILAEVGCNHRIIHFHTTENEICFYLIWEKLMSKNLKCRKLSKYFDQKSHKNVIWFSKVNFKNIEPLTKKVKVTSLDGLSPEFEKLKIERKIIFSKFYEFETWNSNSKYTRVYCLNFIQLSI